MVLRIVLENNTTTKPLNQNKMKQARIKKLIKNDWIDRMRVKKYSSRDWYEFNLYRLWCQNNEEGD